MGREIRRVPPDWEHPKNEQGSFIPLYDDYYLDALNEWLEEHQQWLRGEHPRQMEKYEFFAEYWGDPPSVDSYRKRSWTHEEATHYQVYETVSEGTPITPRFATPDELADWMASNKDYWGYGPHDRETALKFIEAGWVPSMVSVRDASGTRVASGIDAAREFK